MGKIERLLRQVTKEGEVFDQEKVNKVKQVSSYQDLIDLNGEDKAESIKRDLHIVDGLPDEFTERIIGENNLVNISFLKKGVNMSQTVCRIIRPNAANQLKPRPQGTGFLIGNGLLMTNKHVIENQRLCNQFLAEFDYEGDPLDALEKAVRFKFDPDRFFVTSSVLDYCIVALKSESEGTKKVPIESYGFSELKPIEKDLYIGQPLSIIQHPSGLPKMLAIRDSRLSEIKESALYYSTDTEPGSSGSPILNDSWQIIGLHRAGVPARNEQGQYLLKKGGVYSGPQDEPHILWIANKGVLIDSILADLDNKNLPSTADTDKEFLLKHYLPPTEERYQLPSLLED